MSITEQLQEFKTNVAAKAPAEIGGVFAREQQRLPQEADPERFVRAGDVLTDFSLPDATGQPVTLTELLADGPAVIVFYRGAWCPYCNIALGAYQRELAPALAARGIALAAIRPPLPHGSLTMKEKLALEFPVLSDPANTVAEALGIAYTTAPDVVATGLKIGTDLTAVNGQDVVRLPMPTVLVIDSDRVVRFADVHPDYTQRTEVATILGAVNAVLR